MRTLRVTMAMACGAMMSEGAVSAQEAAERPYLLERVGEAAIVQLYADGFEGLSLREKAP